jgi:hypothetical protein
MRSERGFGDLFFYDVATRIGHYLHLAPSHVYLHAGTRDGAKQMGLSGRGGRLSPADVPFQMMDSLSPSEIEDFLCIYKRYFSHLNSGARQIPDQADGNDCLPGVGSAKGPSLDPVNRRTC